MNSLTTNLLERQNKQEGEHKLHCSHIYLLTAKDGQHPRIVSDVSGARSLLYTRFVQFIIIPPIQPEK